MHIDKLAIEELRLLVLLYKTHSLKDSAVRLNVSTPTASRMLGRLRAAVEDELFIRSASAMTPTHACRRLFPRVERILAEMDALTHEPQVFRPSHIKRIFRVMLHEQLFLAHFADVFREVRRLAPGVSIVIEAVSDAGHEALKTGELDAMIFPMTDNVSPDIKAQFLATCDFDILMRSDHPWLAEVNRDGTPDWSALKRYEKIEQPSTASVRARRAGSIIGFSKANFLSSTRPFGVPMFKLQLNCFQRVTSPWWSIPRLRVNSVVAADSPL